MRYKTVILNTFCAYEDKVLTEVSRKNTSETEELMDKYLNDGWEIDRHITLVRGSEFAIGQTMIIFVKKD